MDPMMLSTVLSALGSGGGGQQNQQDSLGIIVPPIAPPGSMPQRPYDSRDRRPQQSMLDLSMLQRIFGGMGQPKQGPNQIPFAGAFGAGMSPSSTYGA